MTLSFVKSPAVHGFRPPLTFLRARRRWRMKRSVVADAARAVHVPWGIKRVTGVTLGLNMEFQLFKHNNSYVFPGKVLFKTPEITDL